eukprot:CAMPEP_0182922772 /NCGR_PEP_ID=MMETSP0105_2-20130417/5014_1 /TAXON_ID=81532 ORGANISM="Acanthoeca-like sp., Strain 10tr" /NCGR_SAMPLE_ID=MMETSP0105_2 /ASSEMBLY_ACC=CAM_ASM_000205 /LENGTH=281 /DNA_ID=CAMNT_0025060425 /DNA_START=74 /DNA_END=919 /DNA_ORIENTATION=-
MAKVAVVTGANQGIGLETVRLLARGPQALSPGSTVYLCSRNAANGEAAVQDILKDGKLTIDVKSVPLDITDDATIGALAAHLQARHGAVDILINNAGMAFKNAAKEPMSEQAKVTIGVNYHGTKAVLNAVLPLMAPNGRVVNVTSRAGLVGKWGPALREQILAPDISEVQLDALMTEFQAEVHAGTHRKAGWPNTTYGVSKAALNALTRIHARDIGAFTASPSVTVNAVCPGWCRTSMAGQGAPRSAAQGADTAVFLAQWPAGPDAPSGLFFGDRKEISYL